MSDVKVAVILYSTYGTNHQVAQTAAEAARAAGAEVRLQRTRETAPQAVVEGQKARKAQAEKMRHIEEAAPEDMEWADAYFFCAPTRFGGAASQMRAFIETLGGLWLKGSLTDKAVTATTSAQNPHGGQEATILSLYTTFMHWGGPSSCRPDIPIPAFSRPAATPMVFRPMPGPSMRRARPRSPTRPNGLSTSRGGSGGKPGLARAPAAPNARAQRRAGRSALPAQIGSISPAARCT